jgi:hypothetical protein
MSGRAYAPTALYYEVDSSGSGTVTLFYTHEGMYIEGVIGHIEEAFDSGTTIDVGDEDTAALFIANNEWTESTVDQIANSRQTTAPDGVFYTAAKAIQVKVAGAPTANGLLQLVFLVWDFASMHAQAHAVKQTTG